MTWLVIFVGLYVVYCGLLFFVQGRLIFPADFAGVASNSLPTSGGPAEQIMLSTDEGETASWFLPAPDCDEDNPAPLAVFFHGNAELIDHQQPIIDLYHGMGVSVFMVEYRGYGHSDGTPSQKHIVADTVAMLGPILQRPEVMADRLVLHGRSIGGGLATQVALQTEPRALIVESTFRSVSGMAMRYGVPPFIVTSPLKSEAAFKRMDIPILIMHGEHDTIVPLGHAKALDKAARDSTLIVFDADHNTLPTPAEAANYGSAVYKHLKDAGVLITLEDQLRPARSSP